MFQHVKETVCEQCEKCQWCWGENFVHTYQMGYEILSAVESYGSELNVETKRKLQQRCVMAPRFLRRTLEVFRNAKQNMLWQNRMIQSRKGCAIQMDTFADMIRTTARELEDSIYEEERMEKKLTTRLRKEKVRVLSLTFFLTKDGKPQDSDDRSHDGQDLHDGAGNGENCLPDLRTPDGSGLWTEAGSGERLCDTDF